MNPQQMMSAPSGISGGDAHVSPNPPVNGNMLPEQQRAIVEQTKYFAPLSIGNALYGRVIRISEDAIQAIREADIQALQRELARGTIIVDRNNNFENLLDFVVKWLNQLLGMGDREKGTFEISPAAVARMGLWVLSQGVVTSPSLTAKFQPDWPSLVKIPPEDVSSLGYFLAKINEGQPPVRRIMRAFAFAVWHHGQLSMKESFVTDAGQIDTCAQLAKVLKEVVAPAEEKFWRNEDANASGIESVIVNALIQYEIARRSHGLPPKKDDLDAILQGPRTLLLRLMRLLPTYPRIVPKLLSNFIALCWPMPLLIGDFGDIMAVFALRHGALGFWTEMLYRHEPNAQYLHTYGMRHGYSEVIREWRDVYQLVKIPGNKFYKIHWRSVAWRGQRDFEQVLKPYVRIQYSETLYEQCKVYYELEF